MARPTALTRCSMAFPSPTRSAPSRFRTEAAPLPATPRSGRLPGTSSSCSTTTWRWCRSSSSVTAPTTGRGRDAACWARCRSWSRRVRRWPRATWRPSSRRTWSGWPIQRTASCRAPSTAATPLCERSYSARRGASTNPSPPTATRTSSSPCGSGQRAPPSSTTRLRSPGSDTRRTCPAWPRTRSRKGGPRSCSRPPIRASSATCVWPSRARAPGRGWRRGRCCWRSPGSIAGWRGQSSPPPPCWSGSASGARLSSTGRSSTMPSGPVWMTGSEITAKRTSGPCTRSSIVARSIYYFTDSRIVGGAERALFMLIAGLDRASWRPTVLLERGEGVEALAEHAQDAGAQVEVVAPMPLGTVGARRTPAFARFLRARRPDVFHAHLSWPLAAKYGLASAVLARVPAVLATLQLVPEMNMDRSNRIQLRLIDRGVGRYIAVSQDVRARLIELGWPARKIDVIYNAVEPDRYAVPAPAGVREELAGSPEGCLVLTVARLHDQKGHRFLLEAAVDVPGAVFAIAGDGPERPTLERQARELGVEDRVLFLGHRQDVPPLLAACDVFALPSLYEGSPLAVLEAMAARRPV